ncbi:hypothetical protein LJR289_000261 [Pseudoduganella sp. LjRoot289]|uniref:hypothetical protein n=1 Tax=Pseudoduganella sp. LjRoot289 TaxID=3342314 RepID=UPI003ED0DDC9
MKRFLLLPVVVLSACSYLPFNKDKDQEAEAARRLAAARKPVVSELASDGSRRVVVDGVEIEKVAFRAGVSSATVERMAKNAGCDGGPGAGLVSEPGPVEVYRMACGSNGGKAYMARCELRQCKPMQR